MPSPTPLSAPQPVPGETENEVVTALLNRAVRVVMLIGANGTGKRTALARWARTQPRVVWLCGRVRHAEARMLLLDIMTAARACGLGTPAFDRASLQGGASDALARALVDDLRAAHEAGPAVTLCVEDASSLTEDTGRLLALIAAHLPAGIQVRLSANRDILQLWRPFLPEQAVETHSMPGSVWSTCEGTVIRRALDTLSGPDRAAVTAVAAQGGVIYAHHEDLTTRLVQAGLPVIVRKGGATLHPRLTALLEEAHAGTPAWQAAAHKAALTAEGQGILLQASLLHLRAGDPAAAAGLLGALVPRWADSLDWPLVRFALGHLPMLAHTPLLRGLHARALIETGDGPAGDALATDTPGPAARLARATHALRTGHLTAARAFVEAGLVEATDPRDVIDLLVQHSLVAVQDPEQDGEVALDALQEAADRAQAIGDAGAHVTAVFTRGYVLRHLGRPTEALNTLTTAAEAAWQLGLPRRLAQATELLGDLHLEAGNVKAAQDALDSVRESALVTDPALLARLQTLQAQVHALTGRPDAALDLLERATHVSLDTGDLLGARYAALHLVPALALRGKLPRAQSLDNALHGRLQWREVSILRASYHALQAYLAFGSGDEDRARVHLSEWAAVTGEGTTVTWLLGRALQARLSGPAMPEALAALRTALSSDGRLAAAGQVVLPSLLGLDLAASQLLPQRSLAPSAHPVVMVKTLGAVGLTVNGLPVGAPGRAVEALAYRLLHPYTTHDEIAAQVWPDAEGSAARRSASVARNTLNHVLTTVLSGTVNGDVLRGGRKGQRNPPWTVHPDVTITTDAHEVLRTFDAGAVRLLNQGLFLPRRHDEWVHDVRERLDAHVTAVGANAGAEDQ